MERVLKKFYTSIRKLENDLFLVSLVDTDNYEVKIKFVTDEYLQLDDYKKFIDEITTSSLKEDDPPIILMNLKKNQCCLIAYPMGDRICLNYNPNWLEINGDNIEYINCFIKAQHSLICMLPVSKIRILRDIHVVNNENKTMTFRYAREFSKDYQMRSITDRNDISRLFSKTPENEYPYDLLDQMIIAEVSKHYNNINVQSRLLLFSTNLKIEQIYKQYQYSKEQITMRVRSIFPTPNGNHQIAPSEIPIVLDVSSFSSKAIQNIPDKTWNLYEDSTFYNDNGEIFKNQVKRYHVYSEVLL